MAECVLPLQRELKRHWTRVKISTDINILFQERRHRVRRRASEWRDRKARTRELTWLRLDGWIGWFCYFWIGSKSVDRLGLLGNTSRVKTHFTLTWFDSGILCKHSFTDFVGRFFFVDWFGKADLAQRSKQNQSSGQYIYFEHMWVHIGVVLCYSEISENVAFSCLRHGIRIVRERSQRQTKQHPLCVYDLWKILFYCYAVFTDERTCFCLLYA